MRNTIDITGKIVKSRLEKLEIKKLKKAIFLTALANDVLSKLDYQSSEIRDFRLSRVQNISLGLIKILRENE